jgi:hypothetical protein
MSEIVEPPVTPATTARVRSGSDIAFTIVLNVLTIISWFAGAFISYLGMAFFGSCSSNGCSGQSVIDGGIILIVLGTLGILASIVMLIIRRRGWPIALITLGVIIVGWIAANVIDIPR